MVAIPTVKIKRLSKFVIINQADYNPKIHELYDPSDVPIQKPTKAEPVVGLTNLPDEADSLIDPNMSFSEDFEDLEDSENPEDSEDPAVLIPVDMDNSKEEIETYGRNIGVELDKRKTKVNMLADLKDAVTSSFDD